ncbi:MAG TPA: acetylxylan esterase [Bacteroidales bacterium]|nr:acetylxylan esterase [Bacteroidales bacterium]
MMKSVIIRAFVILLTVTAWCSALMSQEVPASVNRMVAGLPVNYEEDKVGNYTLPDPLTMLNGKKVKNEKQWYKKRRPEILELFYEFQYGKVPGKPKDMSFNVFDKGTPALEGKALRKQVTVYFTKDTSDYKMDILVYLPADAKGPVPLFLNLSFSPNATIADDPGIRAGTMWGRDGQRLPVSRRGGFGRMNLAQFLDEGIGFASIYYGDIEPDFAKGYKYGIRSYYTKPDTAYPAPDQWGAISAWSWGLSRAMDYFETDPLIDETKVALFGISRLGKTVLWTGVRDDRFGMVIASCGGEGGAALSRRNYGENIDHMTHPTRYFYQFAGNWRNYKDDFNSSPVDAHMLVALMAPRPLLLQTGLTDYWSDPKGEFLSAVAAEPVWKLLGKKGLETNKWPAPGEAILNDLGYYMHEGGHGAMPADYAVFIRFMKMHFFK